MNYIKRCDSFIFNKKKVIIAAILIDSKVAQNMLYDASCSFRSKVVIKTMIETLLPIRQHALLLPLEGGITTRLTASPQLVWNQVASIVRTDFWNLLDQNYTSSCYFCPQPIYIFHKHDVQVQIVVANSLCDFEFVTAYFQAVSLHVQI